jgi:hypothetical protein
VGREEGPKQAGMKKHRPRLNTFAPNQEMPAPPKTTTNKFNVFKGLLGLFDDDKDK